MTRTPWARRSGECGARKRRSRRSRALRDMVRCCQFDGGVDFALIRNAFGMFTLPEPPREKRRAADPCPPRLQAGGVRAEGLEGRRRQPETRGRQLEADDDPRSGGACDHSGVGGRQGRRHSGGAVRDGSGPVQGAGEDLRAVPGVRLHARDRGAVPRRARRCSWTRRSTRGSLPACSRTS